MVAVAARQWWVLVLQGILGIVFGVIAIAVPDIALVTLAYLFAIWAIVAGLTQISVGWRIAEHRGRAWPFAVTGVISVIAGLLAALIPGPTVLFLILLLGWWLAFQGVMEIYAAWRIRKEITGEWLMALGGIARLVVGLIVLAMPIVGAILTVALMATFSIIGGITALLVGVRLRQFSGTGGVRSAPMMGHT
jgi:uncharacterized membrane protein HdeD (DUF308 family)